LFCFGFVVSVVVGVVGLLWILGSLLALMRKITELGFKCQRGPRFQQLNSSPPANNKKGQTKYDVKANLSIM
jgi:hypothetical protein